jgi:hypothetical protein
VDLIISSLFAHHLSDEEDVRFLVWIESHARLGWFINDLSRGEIPYHLFRLLATATGLHPLVQHDGPVSIARAFRHDDWHRLCAEAGLKANEFTLQGHRPARLCVARRKQL